MRLCHAGLLTVLALLSHGSAAIVPQTVGAIARLQGSNGLALTPRGRSLEGFIASLPKAELHVHVEGTLEPEMMLAFAQRNGISLPYADVQAARAARQNYTCLEDFLQEYNLGIKVLRTEQDFYELADAYFARAQRNNIRHVELFFDPEAHTSRGINLDIVMSGLMRAVTEAPAKHGMHAALIACFMRDLGPVIAVQTLQQLEPYYSSLLGIGLDAAEKGFPPARFHRVYEKAQTLGLHRVAHAGEEGGPNYMWEAIRRLHVQRIDHGIHCLEDPALVQYLEGRRLPLTLCPLSNLMLQVYAGSLEKRLRQLLSTQITVTLNSDDPAYFNSSYLNANYAYVQQVAGLGPKELALLAEASFKAAFLSDSQKAQYTAEVQEALTAWESGRQLGGHA